MEVDIYFQGPKNHKYIQDKVWQKATDNDLQGIKNLVGQILDGGLRLKENKSRPNPLSFAAFKGNYEVCKYLLDCGAEVDAKNYVYFNGNNHRKGVAEFTALCECAYAGQLNIAELLIERGADVNARVGWLAQRTKNNTPVHIAFSKRHFTVCQYLVRKGSDPGAINSAGVTAGQPEAGTPRSWNDYGNLDRKTLLTFCTEEVFLLCLRKNYAFLKFILQNKPVLRCNIVQHAYSYKSVGIKQKSTIDQFKQQLDQAVQDLDLRQLECSSNQETLQEELISYVRHTIEDRMLECKKVAC